MKNVLMLATTAAMIEQFNQNNIQILEEMGYRIHVAGNWEKGNPISNERLLRFQNEIMKRDGMWFHIPSTRNPMDFKNNYRAYRKVLQLIEQYHYEFIHCHTPLGSVIGRMAAHKMHTKIIYTAHGFHFYKGAPIKNWLLYYPVEKFLSNWTDLLITINDEDYERANRKFHMKKLEKIQGVGVDLKKFEHIRKNRDKKRKELGVDDDTIVLFSVGEFIKRKNHETIIKAIAQIKKNTDLKIKYLIAGKGALENQYKKLITKLKLEQDVKLLGFRDDVPELCGASDIYLFPSYQEGLPLALMEAMASGLPCIVSKIRGNTDLIIDEKNGFLVEVNNIGQWVEKIVHLAKDRDLQSQMGNVNRDLISDYSTEKINAILSTKIYSQFLS